MFNQFSNAFLIFLALFVGNILPLDVYQNSILPNHPQRIMTISPQRTNQNRRCCCAFVEICRFSHSAKRSATARREGVVGVLGTCTKRYSEQMKSPQLSWGILFPMELRTSTCPESHLNIFDQWNYEMMLLVFNKTSVLVTSTFLLPNGRAHPTHIQHILV